MGVLRGTGSARHVRYPIGLRKVHLHRAELQLFYEEAVALAPAKYRAIRAIATRLSAVAEAEERRSTAAGHRQR